MTERESWESPLSFLLPEEEAGAQKGLVYACPLPGLPGLRKDTFPGSQLPGI